MRIILAGNAFGGTTVADQEVDRALLVTVRVVLNSLKRSVELPFQERSREHSSRADALKEFLVELESARLSFVPADRYSKPHSSQVRPHLAATVSDLNQILNNESYKELLKLPFRLVQSNPIAKQPEIYPGFASKKMIIGEALTRLIEFASEYAAPKSMGEAARDLFELRSLVPRQKIAPAQFDIVSSRLTVAVTPSHSRDEDRNGIEAARASLQKAGAKIIQELQNSNCDKRLLENVQELQGQLSEEPNAVRLGLTNLGCEMMSVAFEQELPIAVVAMLRAHTRGVQLFVGQFPEWNRFLENASTAHLENADIARLHSASRNLVDELKANPEIVDPEVPRTISYLSEMLVSPSASSKRAAFAVLRSIENLVSRIFAYGADFAERTMEKSVDRGSTVAAAVIIAMLSIALTGASVIGPVAGKVPEMNWVKTASEIVKKQIVKLSEH